jgi:hypothetical protein
MAKKRVVSGFTIGTGVEFQNPLIHSQREPPLVGLKGGFDYPLGSIQFFSFSFFFFLKKLYIYFLIFFLNKLHDT